MAKALEVLVVVDDPNIREVLRLYLVRDGFVVSFTSDGRKALQAFQETHPDLVILDIMLPELDGWEVCRRLRENFSVPIIMLTALGEGTDRVAGLELGADDYVVKPFDPNELVARVRAVLRRTQPASMHETAAIQIGSLAIWPREYRVELAGHPVEFAPKEFELLLHLAVNPNQVFTRDQLLESIWGYDYLGESRTIDVHIQRLRKKLSLSEADRPDKTWDIATVWGVGYKLEVNAP